MRSDDFATAHHYPAEESYEAEPEAGFAPTNAFTPISAADRLRERPRRAGGRQQTRVMPPLVPGQQYGLAYEEKDLYWEDAFEDTPCEAAYPPEEPPDEAEQGFFPPPPGYGEPSMYPMDDYQQSYWNHLRDALPAQDYPMEPFSVPSYLHEQASRYPYDPTAVYTPYGQTAAEDWAPVQGWEEEAYFPYGEEPAGYAPMEPEAASYAALYSAPAPSSPQASPDYTNATAGKKLPLMARARQAFDRAFATDHQSGSPRMSLGKVAAICAITVMLAFCLVEMGKIAVSMMRNEAEMKAVREDYYAQSGRDLTLSASRVELLPPGVTFAPTASPPPPVDVSDERALAAAEQEANVVQEASSLQNQRTKETQYAGNPLGNIMEAMEAPRRENADIIGHLRIDGLVDEYVVQRNNTYYLTRNARGSADAAGAAFVDEACGIRTPPENLLLRGQSSVEGKVFASLFNYQIGGVDYVRQHALIRMDTLYEEGEYVIIAVITASSDPGSPHYFNYAGYPSFQSDWHMETYVKGARQHSLYEIPVDVVPSDRLLTISTLGNGTEKECMVIMARKLRAGETMQSLSGALSAIRTQ